MRLGTSAARAIAGLARADFRERTRGYGFLVTLLLVVYLGYAVNGGQVSVHLNYVRGTYNSAWVGSLMALATNFFLGLVGFYLVKNAVARDRATGVGEVLAATRLTKIAYTLGKWLSNFAVLSLMVGILALAAIGMQFYQREASTLDLWALLAPLLLVSLPTMALVAAVALLFETISPLRGSFGNVAYFGVWLIAIAFFATNAREGWVLAPLDPFGVAFFRPSMSAAARAAFPEVASGFYFTMADTKVLRVFTWPGIDWTLGTVLSRLALPVFALGLALFAAIPFDRFDSARSRSRTWRQALVIRPFTRLIGRFTRPNEPGDGIGADALPSATRDDSVSASRSRRRVSVPHWLVAAGDRLPSPARLLLAELRLAMKGLRWWWYPLALGVVIACLTLPLPTLRAQLIPLAFAWPLFVVSALGAREARHGTGQLVLSAAHPISRQLPATWLAGVAVVALLASGALVRLAQVGDFGLLSGLLTGIAFVPSLALALGVWTGSAKPFEVVYLSMLYFGLVNDLPALDFVGLGTSAALGIPTYYLLLAPALLAIAALGRIRQLRS